MVDSRRTDDGHRQLNPTRLLFTVRILLVVVVLQSAGMLYSLLLRRLIPEQMQDVIHVSSDLLEAIRTSNDPRTVMGRKRQNKIDDSKFANTWDEYNPSFVPMYWSISDSAQDTLVQTTMGKCHRKVMVNGMGMTYNLQQHNNNQESTFEIRIVHHEDPRSKEQFAFVNVDVSTVAGIQRAADSGFAESGLVDRVVTSPWLFETHALFSQSSQARLFTVVPHPVDRAVSHFAYLQATYPSELKGWTLEEYAKSDLVENNWMVRVLANYPSGTVTQTQTQVALDLFRRKFLVGLADRIEDSLVRFERYFRWTYRIRPNRQEACRSHLLKNHTRQEARPRGRAYDLLLAQNQFDLQLYEYAKKLFEEQTVFVNGIPKDVRNRGATCCLCDPPEFPPNVKIYCPPPPRTSG